MLKHVPIRPLAALLAGIIFVGWPSHSSAQESRWELYGAEAGLSQQTAQAFFQDSRGYLWIGTRAGLNRFDGARFTTYGIGQGLENDWINDVTEDANGVLWVATNNGLSSWTEADGFENFGVTDGLPDKTVSVVAPDGCGGIWIGTPSGLVSYTDGTWQRFGSKQGLDAQAVVSLAPGQYGDLFVGTNNGLFHWDGSSFSAVDPGRLAGRSIQGLDVDDDGVVWVSDRQFVVGYRNGHIVQEHPGLIGATPLNLVALADGSKWVRTSTGTALVSDAGVREYSTANGLPILTVISVFEDREGILWAGGIGGIAKLIGRPFENYTQDQGLGSNTVWQITRDDVGDLWVATTLGLSRLSSGEWTTFTRADGLPGDFVRTVHVDRDGVMWVGSQGGLSRRTKTGFENSPLPVGSPEIFWMAEDQLGTLWISTRGSGILSARSTPDGTRNWRRVEVPGQRFSNARILAARDGSVWISGDNGLSRWDGNAWMTYTTADGLPANEPYFLAEDLDGVLWFGYHSSRGLTSFDGVEFTTYTTADGLSSDAVYSVGADHDGNVWVGTANGLDRYDGNRFVSFGTKDGFVGSESNAGSFFADADGTIWFGAIGGLSHYDPSHDLSLGEPPIVDLSPFHFGGAPLGPEETKAPYDRRDVSTTARALSNVNREAITLRYRLTPSSAALLPTFFQPTTIEVPWHDLQGADIRFNNLAPGGYLLEVQGSKYGGEWSESAEAHFTISAPLWQRWWFIVLLGAALACAARVVLDWKLRRVQARNALLREHIDQLEEADRIKNEFLSNMSHEIRTPVAGIMGFAAVLREEVAAPHVEFVDHIMASAARLQRTLDSVLALAQLSNDRLQIDLSPVDVAAEVAAAVQAMRPAAVNKDLYLTFRDLAGRPQAYTHDGHLGRILDILIFNAIKFTESGGVEISVEADEEHVHLTVEDTGIGIEEDFLPQLFEPFKQASTGAARTHEGNGLGLTITKRLVELMGGTVTVESTLGEGSRFIISLARHTPGSPHLPPRPERPSIKRQTSRTRLRTFVRK